MKISKHILFLVVICICGQALFGQQKQMDSLLTLLKKDAPDTTKLIHLQALSYKAFISGNYSDGLKYGNKALTLSDTLLSATTNEKIRHITKKLQAKTHSCIGAIYEELSNFGEALKHYFVSLPVLEELKEQKDIAAVHNNIGNTYFKQTKYDEALTHFKISLKIKQEIGDKKGIANSLNSLGNYYITKSNPIEALKYYKASLEMKKQIGNKKSIAIGYNNIGIVYREQGNYEEALKNYFIAQKIREEIKDEPGIAHSLMNIGTVLGFQKKYREATKQLLLARDMAIRLDAKIILKETYHELSDLGEAEGNFKTAYENHKLYILYRDSLNSEGTREQAMQSKMTYEFEKKEAVAEAEHKKEIENNQLISEEKNRKQTLISWCVSIGLLMVLIFLTFIFHTLRTTRKQKIIIERKNQEVEEKQKEIIDSITYARRIQRALMASEKYIEKALNKLNK